MELQGRDDAYQMRDNERTAKEELLRVMRRKWHDGEISEEAYYAFKEAANKTRKEEHESSCKISR